MSSLRLRRPDQDSKPTPSTPYTGIIQDKIRRTTRRPWSPSFSLAVRILLLIRVSGAMYSNIDDCDEVFNFWEPLHFFDRGAGFQTWELSPVYALRSWAYILLHLPPTRLASLFGPDKRPSFFAVRIFLAVISTLCEAHFYRSVHQKINERVGRYLFFMLLVSAGMWNASAAFLPSSFAMYTSTLAFSYATEPVSSANHRRTLLATLLFATGGIVGWPFSLALAIPFVIEELFVFGADRVPLEKYRDWMLVRWKRLFAVGSLAALIFIPVVGIDSLAYGRVVIVPWNIIKYNIFGGSERGPELYGTSPWYFYILNLLLNFNVLVPLAFMSLPSLAVTYVIDPMRLGIVRPSADQSSPFTMLGLRLLPFYVWMGILTLQAHKEERFMFPAYPMLCFNAAVTLYFARGWMETAFISVTKSPYRASKTTLFRTFTLSVLVFTSIISLSRIIALWKYYHAPLSVMFNFEARELPRLLNASGLLPDVKADDEPAIDLSLIREFNLTLCFSKEWHRFPGHYLVPDGVRVNFVKSEFNGLLPGHFGGGEDLGQWWMRAGTKVIPNGLNDLNKEEPGHYVSIHTCDYLVDLDFPKHPASSLLEPRYSVDTVTWERVYCLPFLDARHSPTLSRTLWIPVDRWKSMNEYGDYCLLRNRVLVSRKEEDVKAKHTF